MFLPTEMMLRYYLSVIFMHIGQLSHFHYHGQLNMSAHIINILQVISDIKHTA